MLGSSDESGSAPPPESSQPGFTERLREALLGRTLEKAAEDIGCSVSGLKKWLRGESRPGSKWMEPIAALRGLSVHWLTTGQGPKFAAGAGVAEEQVSYDHDPEFTEIPRYEVHASAGAGALVEAERLRDHLVFRTSWLRDTLRVALNKLALISAKGDSMQPTICEGDVLLVERDPERLIEGAIYVLEMDEMLMVKRVQLLADGTLLISSDNPRYKPDSIPKGRRSDVRIFGRVRWAGRTF